MAGNKTRETEASADDFIESIEDDGKRRDCRAVAELMREVTGEEPRMWGPGMVGFGSYHYRYDSGREGDWFLTADVDMGILRELVEDSVRHMRAEH